MSTPTDRKEASTLSDAEIEAMARAECGELDWSIPSNLGATAVQRAWFRVGARALESRLAVGQPVAQWREWFARSGDGSMTGLSDKAYREALAQWIADGAALYANSENEARQRYSPMLNSDGSPYMQLNPCGDWVAFDHAKDAAAQEPGGASPGPTLVAERTPVAAAPDRPQEPRVASTGALKRFEEMDADPETNLRNESPLERLRFFCSLALSGQDWLDVEPFFTACEPADRPQEPQG